MKRFVAFFVAFVLTISALPFAIGAERYDGESLVVQFEDGSYITEKITLTQFRRGGTVSGSKEQNFMIPMGIFAGKLYCTELFHITAQVRPALHQAVMSPYTPLIGM